MRWMMFKTKNLRNNTSDKHFPRINSIGVLHFFLEFLTSRLISLTRINYYGYFHPLKEPG
jgi:hypothetical protein